MREEKNNISYIYKKLLQGDHTCCKYLVNFLQTVIVRASTNRDLFALDFSRNYPRLTKIAV